MITIEYIQTNKVILSDGFHTFNSDCVGKIMEEMENHKLLSSSCKDWLEYTGDYDLFSVEVVALNDTHIALRIVHQESGSHREVVDTRFYELKSK